MRIGGVDIPGDLLLAQRTGNLVVFAGAGVSMGPPSNLPSFRRLAQRIAAGTTETLGENEAEDRFLGRLQKNKVQVHELALHLLSDPTSAAAPIHRDLLRLFPDASAVRLVTTNFDRHFDTAAAEFFPDPVETFIAPALPRGDKYTGLVYVHGSVTKRADDLVLTDEDFGRAYVTDGWASRFLTAMFSTYTVLFVGYSHRDIPMHYLARGLVGTAPRYALIGERSDDPAHWQYLGIEPIIFPMQDDGDFSALGACVNIWANLASEGALDKELRIRTLAQGLPPTDEEDQDYLQWAIETPDAVRYFTRYANPAFLPWLDARGLLDCFFRKAPLTPAQDVLARWLAETYIPKNSDQLFQLATQRHASWNPAVLSAIIWTLCFSPKVDDPTVFAKWASLLLQEPSLEPSVYERLLDRAIKLDLPAIAVELFSHLLIPKLEVEREIRYQLEDEDGSTSPVTVQIRFAASHYELDDAWQHYLRPRIAELGERLVPRLALHLSRAYTLLHTWGKASEQWDPLGWGRSAIEPHEQDQFRKTEDVLIDAMRDILEWKIQNQADHAQRDIEALAAARVPLLDRIAIHGVRLSPAWTADAKIAWLLGAGHLFRIGLKHEAYLLLRDAFPAASPQVQAAVLQKVDNLGDAFPGLEPDTIAYERFNLLSWLLAANPGASELVQRIDELRARHPDKHFAVREYPDLEHWSTSFWGDEEESDSEDDVRAMTFEAIASKLAADRQRQDLRWGLSGFLRGLRDAVSADVNWSLGLGRYLLDRGERGEDVWAALIQGWTAASLAEEHWRTILTLLDDQELLTAAYASVADLLQRAVESRAQQIPPSLWDQADAMAGRIWDAIPEDEADANDWLQRALNHAAGKLTRFWLKLLELARKATDAGAPANFQGRMKARFEMIIGGVGSRNAVGVAMLASQLGFLFYVDEQWTRTAIFPLFDWDREPCLALQAWDGFLVWASWNPPLFLALRPMFKQAFAHLDHELAGRRNRFVEYVAVSALFGTQSPLEDDWLSSFLKVGTPLDRSNFARQVSHYIRDLTAEQKKNVWTRWLRDYIKLRLAGAPLPLENREIEEMLEWAALLPPVFDEAVDLLCQSRPTELDNTPLFYHLKQADLASTNPDAVAKIVAFICAIPNVAFYHVDELENLVRSVVGKCADRELLLRCCEGIGRLNGPNALNLRELVMALPQT